ncbi:MAG TPA: apolipoprotein N-acyltransferase [Chitinophagales bacterium]|nr:apolipoprotein N-acyltransferase [Chitinophagales bacterium]
MNKRQKYFLAISSGVLLWLAWPPLPFFPLLFVGFVPILWLEEECSTSSRSAKKFFGYSYLALLIWNVLTTWWVGATVFGTKDISTALAGVFANTANPLLMCIPLLGFHRTKKRLGTTWGYVSLIAYWITFEYIHLRWDLTWPWLTLGNGFAQFPQVVQWYQFTGVFGGTLWILIANIMIYQLIRKSVQRINMAFQKQPTVNRNYVTVSLLLLIPVFISLVIYFTYREKGVEKQVVVIQPNIDPYNEKFDFSTLDKQLNTLLRLSAEKIDQQTDYLVWPETAIPQGIFINDLAADKTIETVKNFLKSYPNLKLITGINAYKKYDTDETATARYADSGHFWYDAFNTAIQIDSSHNIPYYHKSKLVPGVESMPYPQLFKFLEPLAIQMGGISGSLGKQEHRDVFKSVDSTGVAPMICYESIYGEYSTEYVRRGGNLLFIVTNDGWWGNTAGYKQHLQYARLRAVETRRDMAQSANTGTSAFINQRGDLSATTAWWQPAVIKATLHANDEFTFYVRYGDYIGRAAILMSILLAVFAFIRRFSGRKKMDSLH